MNYEKKVDVAIIPKIIKTLNWYNSLKSYKNSYKFVLLIHCTNKLIEITLH